MRNHLQFILLLIPLVLVSTACGTLDTEARATAITPQPHMYTPKGDGAQPTIKLGHHYRPLGDGTPVNELAREASFIILSKNYESYRDELRQAGYRGLVLQYIRGSEADGPRTAAGSDECDETHKPWGNNVASQTGDFCKYIHPHEDWFLHNGEGERLKSNDDADHRVFYHMNPGSEGWRAFVLSRLKQRMFGDESTPPLGYDGIFFDNVELNIDKVRENLTNSDGEVEEYATNEAYVEAWRGWLEYMRNGLGTTVPIWANMIGSRHTANEWNPYLPYLDGGMNEAFATGYNRPLTSSQYDNELKQAEYVLAHGKGYYAVSQGNEKDTRRQQFALASYLLIARPDGPSYFRYTRADEEYDYWWYYDNYNVRLGPPLGTRYAIKNGWRRDFTNGYVTVDLQKRQGTISLAAK